VSEPMPDLFAYVFGPGEPGPAEPATAAKPALSPVPSEPASAPHASGPQPPPATPAARVAPAAEAAREEDPDLLPRPHPLAGLVAAGPRLAEAGAKNPEFLGHLFYVSVADTFLTREELEAALAESGYADAEAKELTPKNLSERGAFRKAARRAEERVRRVPLDGPGEAGPHANVLVREIRSTEEGLVWQVVREVVDADKVSLSYDPVYQLELRPPRKEAGEETSCLSVKRLPAAAAEDSFSRVARAEGEAVAEVRASYEFNRRHYDTDAVRRLLTNALKRCYPVTLRGSGGLYFVARDDEATVRRVARLAKGCAERGRGRDGTKGSGYVMAVAVPMVDEAGYRHVVADSLEDQVRRESGALHEEMRKILKGEAKASAGLRRRYVERVRALSKNVKAYEELLKTEIDGARSGLELAGAAAMRLMDLPDEDGADAKTPAGSG